MPVQPGDFSTLAIESAENDSEIYLRNAISRSYYAVHHYLLSLEASLPVNDHRRMRGKGTHEVLNSKFSNLCDQGHLSDGICRKLKRMGFISNSMKLARVKADYRLNDQIFESDVSIQLRMAEKIQILLGDVETDLAGNLPRSA